MKITLRLVLLSSVLFAACSSHTKKAIVYANTDADINDQTKTITQKDNEGHLDKEVQFNTGDKVVIKVVQKDGSNASVELPDDGYYIINVKAKDTIVGGYQKYSSPQEANRVMSQEELKHNIDSLRQMILGQNTNPANRTYFIPPNTAQKITANTDATIVGPYHRMTSVEKQGDKEPEVYRFYSVKEVRETVDKLQKLTSDSTTNGEKPKGQK
jgi:hypothetical protein